MERKDQLRNVAFGGAWSEQIAGREALAVAIDTLDEAATCADMIDPRRQPSVIEALDEATADHPKGQLLRDAWMRAAGRSEPSVRVAELMTIAAYPCGAKWQAASRIKKRYKNRKVRIGGHRMSDDVLKRS